MYYFDHSATTPIHPQVIDLMNEINKYHYGNPSSIYKIGKKSRLIIEKARDQLAKSISAEPEQIIFTSGGTESNNQVFWSLLHNTNNHVVSNVIEHPAVIKVLEFLKISGINYDLVKVKKDGIISSDSINKVLTPKTSLISLMLANNEIGTIQPVKEVVKIAKKRNIMVHTDAVQCMGKIKLDVRDLGIDFLSLSAHKFYGPKGIGALYIKKPKKMLSLIIGGNQEKSLRAGTENMSSIAGMGLASKLANSSINTNTHTLNGLESYFKNGLQTFYPNAIFNGNQSKKLPGLISISFPGENSNILMAKLDRAKISVSNGSACGSGNIKPSPILSAIGINKSLNLSTLRFSFGFTNTKKQIDYLLNQLENILLKQ